MRSATSVEQHPSHLKCVYLVSDHSLWSYCFLAKYAPVVRERPGCFFRIDSAIIFLSDKARVES